MELESLMWSETVEVVKPHVVRILTPSGRGTGFQFHRPKDGLVVIATAAHVIEHAHAWEEPIRITLAESEPPESVLLKPSDRAVFLDEDKDTAALVFGSDKLPSLPKAMLELAPEKKYLKAGNQIGWLGFPSVASSLLCFFGGRVSAWEDNSYLVDGVAINGVSGGPAFHPLGKDVILIGVLSAYIPNRATGEALPGLSVVRDVSHFHELVKDFKSLDEAQEGQSPAAEPPAANPAPEPKPPRTPVQ